MEWTIKILELHIVNKHIFAESGFQDTSQILKFNLKICIIIDVIFIVPKLYFQNIMHAYAHIFRSKNTE